MKMKSAISIHLQNVTRKACKPLIQVIIFKLYKRSLQKNKEDYRDEMNLSRMTYNILSL